MDFSDHHNNHYLRDNSLLTDCCYNILRLRTDTELAAPDAHAAGDVIPGAAAAMAAP